jgi:hypothetical protein
VSFFCQRDSSKHHRIPAPNISFPQPNLPFLIQEIETTLLKTQPEADE